MEYIPGKLVIVKMDRRLPAVNGIILDEKSVAVLTADSGPMAMIWKIEEVEIYEMRSWEIKQLNNPQITAFDFALTILGIESPFKK